MVGHANDWRRRTRRKNENAVSSERHAQDHDRDEQRGEEEERLTAELSPPCGPPTVIVVTAMSRPRNIAPASPMKIRAGLKLWGRNPTRHPTTIIATSGADVRALEQAGLEQAVGVEEQREPAIATIPAARPSRPSIRLIALASSTTASTVTQRREVGRQHDVLVARERNAEVEHRHAEQRQDAARSAPDRRSSPAATPRGRRRSRRPTNITPAASRSAERLRRAVEHLVELRDLRRDAHRDERTRRTSPRRRASASGSCARVRAPGLGHRADARGATQRIERTCTRT